MEKTDKEILDIVRRFANANINCGHSLCSGSEAFYEEQFGTEILKILDTGIYPYEIND